MLNMNEFAIVAVITTLTLSCGVFAKDPMVVSPFGVADHSIAKPAVKKHHKGKQRRQAVKPTPTPSVSPTPEITPSPTPTKKWWF